MCIRENQAREKVKSEDSERGNLIPRRSSKEDKAKWAKEVKELKTWAYVCGFLHLSLTIIAISLMAINSFRDYGVTLVNYVLHREGYYESRDVVFWNLTIGCAIFAVLSSLFHFITIADWENYIKMLKLDYDPKADKDKLAGGNMYRWIEYSLSAAVMNVNIAVICSVKDVNAIILIFSLTALVMPYGLTLEVMRKSVYYQYILWASWLAYFLGGLTFWITLLSYDDLDQVPAVAWTVLASLTFLFNVFGAWNLTVNYVDPITYEKGYYTLSVIAKSLLFALIIWGGSTGGDWLDMKYSCTPPTTATLTPTPSRSSTRTSTRTPSHTTTYSHTPTPTMTMSNSTNSSMI